MVLIIIVLLAGMHVPVMAAGEYDTFFKSVSFDRQLILSGQEIEQYNLSVMDTVDAVDDILFDNLLISHDDLIQAVTQISVIPDVLRYSHSGQKLTGEYYDSIIENMNLQAAEDLNPIHYGIVVTRTKMKTFPTDDSIYSSPSSKYDRFLETTLYAGEPVAVLYESLDLNWFFVKMYNYSGWVKKSDIASCSSELLSMYMDCPNFLTITSANTLTTSSHIQLDLGSRFPLLAVDMNYNLIGLIPARNESGQLYFIKDSIERIDCTKGFLEYSTSNVMKIAFKVLDEPYGWGGDLNARDCSSYVMDVFRVFGIRLPRNTSQQENIPGEVVSINSSDDYNALIPGSLLFMNGHVMIYLGEYGGKRFIIHDTPGYYSNGKFINANGVVITTLSIYSSIGLPYEQLIYRSVTIK
ncbi:MAG: SH3 domain-containing protein [Clostridia bacterium]|nr:SH3 domain-containing protein [Clostridia bacterium]